VRIVVTPPEDGKQLQEERPATLLAMATGDTPRGTQAKDGHERLPDGMIDGTFPAAGEADLEVLGIEEDVPCEALQAQFQPVQQVKPAISPEETAALQQLAAVVRGRQTRSALRTARLEANAARLLQRAVRGHIARKVACENAAARRLQRMARGHAARQEAGHKMLSMLSSRSNVIE